MEAGGGTGVEAAGVPTPGICATGGATWACDAADAPAASAKGSRSFQNWIMAGPWMQAN